MSVSNVDVLKPVKDEIAKQKKERKARKENSNFSMTSFLKTWMKRLFYTLFIFMVVYVTIIGCTVMVPTVMGFLIRALGYTVSNNAEMLLASFAGLFFVLWSFALSFIFIRFAWRKYINGMKSTLSGKPAERLDDLK